MSYKSELLRWLDELPPGRFFWSRDVPVPSSTARPILSRAAADPASQIMRVAHGFYYKTPPHDGHKSFWRPDSTISALVYAGPGSGLRGYSALNRLGWSAQLPAKERVVTLRKVKPFQSYIRYTQHTNPLRRGLNWLEVTLLEALTYDWFIEDPWSWCVERVETGQVARSFGFAPHRGVAPRCGRMLEAVDHEPLYYWWSARRLPVNFADLKCRIEEVCDAAASWELAEAI